MRLDLHNHTTYCNHANGSIESYITRAANLGIDVFGFSCHAPMDFDEQYRMSFAQLPDYLEDIARHTDFANRHSVELLCALEVDYILGREDLLQPCVLCADVDYLIGSVHFLGGWGFDNPEFIGQWKSRDTLETWDTYLNAIQGMIASGHFQIVGHFDLLKIFGNTVPAQLHGKIEECLVLMRDCGMVLEVNAAGLRKPIGEQYPSRAILEIAKKVGVDVTLSSDAHEVNQIGFGYDICAQMLYEIGYRRIALFRKREKYLVDLS